MYKFVKQAFMAAVVCCLAQAAAAGGDATAGESKVQVCAACHGADGNSLAPTFPKLAGLGEKYILKQMHDIKAGDRVVPEMTGILTPFSDEDMADIAAYFAKQTMQLTGAKEKKVLTNAGVEVDTLILGERIFRAGNKETAIPACMGCHSPTGQGNSPAGYPRLGGQFPEYIEKQLRAFRAGERTNDGDAKTMRSVARNLTDAELISVANFISGLN
ncbi:c-type cytochrome [Halioxenophilus sp. WMMB6]|uniref:c-type cytochrome n=1 Tax=Halioxenophilus sp. WMMB6 TaxID=3073815 RepID=UPI00295F36FF|nr:c-type cytochrome [Halioxenophilus sp. WMMB6]